MKIHLTGIEHYTHGLYFVNFISLLITKLETNQVCQTVFNDPNNHVIVDEGYRLYRLFILYTLYQLRAERATELVHCYSIESSESSEL